MRRGTTVAFGEWLDRWATPHTTTLRRWCPGLARDGAADDRVDALLLGGERLDRRFGRAWFAQSYSVVVCCGGHVLQANRDAEPPALTPRQIIKLLFSVIFSIPTLIHVTVLLRRVTYVE